MERGGGCQSLALDQMTNLDIMKNKQQHHKGKGADALK